MPSPSIGRRRRGRPRRNVLDRDRIARAALDEIDTRGIERLSMRRVAERLDVEAASLYNHVSGRVDLLRAVTDLLYIETPLSASSGDWVDDLRRLYRAVRRRLLAHPRAVPLVTTYNPQDLRALRPVERGLAIVRAAGFEGRAAVSALRTLTGFTIGYLSGEVGVLNESHSLPERETAQRRLESLPDEFKNLRELAAESMTSGDAEFEYGLNVVLQGLQDELRSSKQLSALG